LHFWLTKLHIAILGLLLFASCGIAITGDFNSDNVVDVDDLRILAGQWLKTEGVNVAVTGSLSGACSGIYIEDGAYNEQQSYISTGATPFFIWYATGYWYCSYAKAGTSYPCFRSDTFLGEYSPLNSEDGTATVTMGDNVCDLNADDIVNFLDYQSMLENYTGEFNYPRYTLTTDVSGDGGITVSPIADDYRSGSQVTLFATPADGWYFLEWLEDLTGNNNPSTLYMSSNKTVYASFASLTPAIDTGAIDTPSGVVYENTYIDLSKGVTSVGSLYYEICSIPTGASLIASQPYAQYITNAMLPYRVPANGSTIVLRAFTDGHKYFNYRACNGEHKSDTVTMDVDISANTADSLTFTGNESVIIPDSGDTMDAVSGFGVAFYYKTMMSDCGLFYKQDGGNGYYACVENGRFRFYVVKSDGKAIGYGRTDAYRVDTGLWMAFGFSIYEDKAIVFGNCIEAGWSYGDEYTGQPILDYSNSSPVTIGRVPGKNNFIGEFDRLRFYSGCTGELWDLKMMFVLGYPPEDRQTLSDVSGWESNVVPDARFMFDEGTGSTVADDKHTPTLTGDADSIPWLPNAGNDEVVVSSNFSPVKRVKRSTTVLNDEDCIKHKKD
jgi:hypothetical protein